MLGVTSSHALRMHAQCPWRHSEGARNVDNTAIRRALSPLRPRGSVPADVHGDSAPTRFHRMVLMTLYGTGARRAITPSLQEALSAPSVRHLLVVLTPDGLVRPCNDLRDQFVA